MTTENFGSKPRSYNVYLAFYRFHKLYCLLFLTILVACTNFNIAKPRTHEFCERKLRNYKGNTKVWEHITLNFYRSKQDSNVYHLSCADGVGIVFHEIPLHIDFATIQDLGAYLMDKDSVYYYYDISDGTMIFKLEEADRKTFRVFGKSSYARDKNHVYYSRHGIMEEADLETFEVLDFKAPFTLARDKNHVYMWDEVLQDTSEVDGLRIFLENNK